MDISKFKLYLEYKSITEIVESMFGSNSKKDVNFLEEQIMQFIDEKHIDRVLDAYFTLKINELELKYIKIDSFRNGNEYELALIDEILWDIHKAKEPNDKYYFGSLLFDYTFLRYIGYFLFVLKEVDEELRLIPDEDLSLLTEKVLQDICNLTLKNEKYYTIQQLEKKIERL